MYIDFDGSINKNNDSLLNGIDLSNPHAPTPINYTNFYTPIYFDGVTPGFKLGEDFKFEKSPVAVIGCRGYSFCFECQVITSSVCQCMGVCGKCKSNSSCREIPNGFFTHYYNDKVNGIYRCFEAWPKMQFYPIKRKEN